MADVRAWSTDRYDVPYLERHTAKLPPAFLPLVGVRYQERYQEQGQQAANIWIREEAAMLTAGNLNLAASEDELREEAARLANLARLKLSHKTNATDTGAIYGELRTWAEGHHAIIEPQRCEISGKGWTLAGLIARLTDKAFWRRQLRRAIGRAIEAHAISYGLVHRRAGLYASDDTVKAWEEQQRRNAAALANTIAENEEGHAATLADLSAAGVANPKNRRHELMTRMRGFEDFAKEVGHVALFVTWTLPSAYHARHAESGEENRRYRGYTPKQGAALLSKQWQKARAKLARRKAFPYGFRVAEPHHDGTPHWHMVLFMVEDITGTVIQVLEQYAFEPHADELSTAKAREARFKVKRIDPAQGSATGYLSKYISKNIDGGKAAGTFDAGQTDEDEATPIPEAAKRVRAWASRWGIRQFQQVGGPGVTIWRELRRLRKAEDGTAPVQGELFPFWAAADAGNWHGYIRHMGGAVRPRADRPAQLYRQEEEGATTRYGEERPADIKGVRLGEEITVTRRHVWQLKPRPKAGAPWTRVNNCTRSIEETAGAPWAADVSDEITTARDADGFELFKLPGLDPALCTISNPEEVVRNGYKQAILNTIAAKRRRGGFGAYPAPPLGAGAGRSPGADGGQAGAGH